MADPVDLVFKLSLVVFMAGSLMATGLGMTVQAAASGLRNARFAGYGLLFGFVLGPLVAGLLILVIPLTEAYALGLVLLGLTPSAPFLPQMLQRAKGDMDYVPAMLLLSAAGTIVLLPLAVPVLAPELTVSPWTIAQPLLLLVLLPLLVGLAIRHVAAATAAAILPAIAKVTGVAAVLLLVLCAVLYGQDFFRAIGHFAILAQLLFFLIVTAVAYVGARGLSQGRRSVLALGVCTRNVGAAMAPLLSAAAIDENVIVMVVLAVPLQMVAALIAARIFAARAEHAGAGG